MKTYKVTVYKTIEEDSFEEGCIGNFQDLGEFYTFKSSDIDLCITRLKNAVDLDNCEEFEGRLEYNATETDDGDTPSAQCLEAWKKGPEALKKFNTKIWMATYSVYLESIETTELNANILKGVK